MGINKAAEALVAKLPIACLYYDHRGWGRSGKAGRPRNEIIPFIQISDFQDAITYVQGREDIDASKICAWGSSYSGGHVAQIAATDRRVTACISQAPVLNASETFHRLMSSDVLAQMQSRFKDDRLARAAGKKAETIRVTDTDPTVPCCLSSQDAYDFYTEHEKKLHGLWQNEVTIRSVEAGLAYNASFWMSKISPTPYLLIVAKHDTAGPIDLAMTAYSQALEPKQCKIIDCQHFDIYSEKPFEESVGAQIEFLRENFCT